MTNRNYFLPQYIADHPIYSQYTRKNQVNYNGQKSMAKKRNIDWQFTFYEWIVWWVNTGRFNNRGVENDQYQMCRINDSGPYAPTNVYCDTAINNKYAKYKNPPIIATNIKTGEETEYSNPIFVSKNNFDYGAVKKCLKGKNKKHHGHTFRYKY